MITVYLKKPGSKENAFCMVFDSQLDAFDLISKMWEGLTVYGEDFELGVEMKYDTV